MQRVKKLSEIVTDVLISSQFETQSKFRNLDQLEKFLSQATAEEINFEYNSLSQQKLWTVILSHYFYSELIDRIRNNMTFMLSCSWNTTKNFMDAPSVILQLGFEDSYQLPGIDGIIGYHDKYFVLTNESFGNNVDVVIPFLLGQKINAYLHVSNEQVVIVGIESSDYPFEVTMFSKLAQIPELSKYVEIKIPVMIKMSSEFELMNGMLSGITENKYPVIDPNVNSLYNELKVCPNGNLNIS
jgi:hypothetical protein